MFKWVDEEIGIHVHYTPRLALLFMCIDGMVLSASNENENPICPLVPEEVLSHRLVELHNPHSFPRRLNLWPSV